MGKLIRMVQTEVCKILIGSLVDIETIIMNESRKR